MGATAAQWSTAAVGPDQAFDYWRDLICDAFVQLSAKPVDDGPFTGAIAHRTMDEVELSTVTADAQSVDRTRALIARSHEDFLLASIQLDGFGEVRQDGRTAGLRPGAMAFYDSTRPYTLDFARSFRQLVIQVPRSAVPRGRVRDATAVALDTTGPARLVTDFFVGLAREAQHGPLPPGLAPHAIGLFEFALDLAGSTSGPPTEAATRQTVRDAIARAAGEPGVSADDVARACHVSRRTLFRILESEGRSFSDLLRAERVRRATTLLRARPDLPVAVVAIRCGFAGEAQFHRTFREATGTTPAGFRRHDDGSARVASPGGTLGQSAGP
jgi:AraC-like DNA-binding protein